MTSASVSAVATPECVDLRRLPRAALITIAAAIIANIVALLVLRVILPLPEGFRPLTSGSIIFFTLIGTALGTLVYWLIAKVAKRPIRTWRIVAVIALILSILPNFAAMSNPAMFPFPGGTALAFAALTVFHLIAGIICIILLPRLTRAA